jgi:hypothetical protein
MGRGRAKAKQTKVARELKYSTHHTDFDALQRELSNHPPSSGNGDDPFDEDDYEDDDFRR